MKRIFAASAAPAAAAFFFAAPISAKTGTLILAHGGTRIWNRAVREALKEAKLPQPAELVFGMQLHSREVRELQRAVQRLERAGARRIRVIPFFLSSHSELQDHLKYLFRLRPDSPFSDGELRALAARHAGFHSLSAPLAFSAKVEFAPALDEGPEILEALETRARELLHSPAAQSLILVAHGPSVEGYESAWQTRLEFWARALKKKFGLKRAGARLLLEDAAPARRAAASERLRRTVRDWGADSQVLVLPVLLAPGGIEDGISRRLSGLSVEIGAPLLPHPALSRWLRRRALGQNGD